MLSKGDSSQMVLSLSLWMGLLGMTFKVVGAHLWQTQYLLRSQVLLYIRNLRILHGGLLEVSVECADVDLSQGWPEDPCPMPFSMDARASVKLMDGYDHEGPVCVGGGSFFDLC